ncbi:MAG: PDZ domain-containing protein, partial [Pirellulaceae bacterium]
EASAKKEMKAAAPVVAATETNSAKSDSPAGSGFIGVKCDGRVVETVARISAVYAGGPAEAAGLKVGDEITQVGEKTISNFNDLRAIMGGLKAGDQVLVQVNRDGQPVIVKLTLGTTPK